MTDVVRIYRGTDYELSPFETHCADCLSVVDEVDSSEFRVVDPNDGKPFIRAYSKNMFGYTRQTFDEDDD